MKKLIVLLALFLTGCSLFAAPVVPTMTKYPTFAPGPTATIAPTITITIPPTITPTITPTPPSFPTPDPVFYQQYQFSPDGKWIAWSGKDPQGNRPPDLLIESQGAVKSWPVTLGDNVHEQFCLGGCAFEPVLWAEDGSTVYVRAYIPFEGAVFSTSDAVAMMKVSLEDGEITSMLPPRIPSYFFTISPDQTWLLFSFDDHGFPVFTILNLDTHERNTYTLSIQSDHFGDIFWSPFNRCIVFESYRFGKDDAIYLLNTKDGSNKILYEGDLFEVDSIEWVSETQIKVTFTTEDQPILINTQTGESAPVN